MFIDGVGGCFDQVELTPHAWDNHRSQPFRARCGEPNATTDGPFSRSPTCVFNELSRNCRKCAFCLRDILAGLVNQSHLVHLRSSRPSLINARGSCRRTLSTAIPRH